MKTLLDEKGYTDWKDVSHIDGSGSPLGAKIPSFINQLYHDIEGGIYWTSVGLTSLDWVSIGTGLKTGINWGPNSTVLDLSNNSFYFTDMFDTPIYSSIELDVVTIDDGGNGNTLVLSFSNALIAFPAPNLKIVTVQEIHANGNASSAGITSCSTPELTTLNGDFNLYDNPLTFLDLSKLETVSGSFDVIDQVDLVSIELSALISIGSGTLYIYSCL